MGSWHGKNQSDEGNNKAKSLSLLSILILTKRKKTERGSYTKSTTDRWGYDGDVTVTYGKLLGDVHQVNAVLG